MAFKKDWSKLCLEKDHNSGKGAFDPLLFLWEMNLIHVLEDVVTRIDSYSLSNCLKVSKTWNEILRLILDQNAAMKLRKKVNVVHEESDGAVVTTVEVEKNLIAIGKQDGMVNI